MSHYTVAVIHKDNNDLDTILEPFCEEVEEDSPYREFSIEVEAGKEEEYRKEELKGKYWEKLENYDKVKNFKKIPVEDFMRQHSGYKIDESGNWGYFHNPNAKWDWFVIGGRWENMLVTKDGELCNSAVIKDIDFAEMGGKQKEMAEKQWEEYGKELSGTKSEYINKQGVFITHAILINGEWLESGRMGWFGMNTATKEKEDTWEKEYSKLLEKFIKENPNDMLTIVDCHI